MDAASVSPPGSSGRPLLPREAAAHVVPFLLWVLVVGVLGLLPERLVPRLLLPWSYALKSVLCAGLFLWYRPWQWYPACRWRNLPLALLAGVAVAVLWILPETPWAHAAFPALQEFYHRWLILWPGALPDYFHPEFYPALPPEHPSLAYSPGECGWGLTLAKLAGSAFVIAVIEEFFFLGFLYRWLCRHDFLKQPLTALEWQPFLTMLLLFGFEHDRWLAGLVAGAVYGWLMLRTGDLWSAAIAHVTTNLLLGGYVVLSGQYGFW